MVMEHFNLNSLLLLTLENKKIILNTYGDYKITVSEYFGDASVFFKVVEDPDTFTDIRTPYGLKTDSSEYILGSALKIW